MAGASRRPDRRRGRRPACRRVPGGVADRRRRPPWRRCAIERLAMPSWRRRSWSKASATRWSWFRTLHRRRLGHLAVVAAVAVEVEQVHGDLDAADAVGDGVVELQHQRGPVVLEALDRRRPPTAGGPGRSPAWRSARRCRARRGASRRRRPAASGGGRRGRSWGRPPSGAGRSTAGSRRTRWRSRGTSRVVRSTASSRRSRSGAWSNTATVVMVDRSSGSFSIVHMSASASLIRCSKRMSLIDVSGTARSAELALAGPVGGPELVGLLGCRRGRCGCARS